MQITSGCQKNDRLKLERRRSQTRRQTRSAGFLRKLSALVCDGAAFLRSSGKMFEQRVGCFRAVSNPNENVGASSGSTFLEAGIILSV